MLHAPIPAPETISVRATGYYVETAITDGDGKVTYQSSPIYRTREKAEQVRADGMRPLKLWERKLERTVIECSSAFTQALDDEDVARPAEGYVPARAA